MLYLSNMLLCRLCTVAVVASRDVSLEAGPAKAILYDILIGVACVAKHRAASPSNIRTDNCCLYSFKVCDFLTGIELGLGSPPPPRVRAGCHNGFLGTFFA